MNQRQRPSAADSAPRLAAILIGVLVGLYLAREILIPLAFAITLALMLSPAVNWLEKLRIRRFPAVVGVMIVALTISAGVSYVIFNELVHVANDLPGYRESIHKKLVALRLPNQGSLGRAAQSVTDLGKELANVPDPPTTAPAVPGQQRAGTPANPLPVQLVEPPASGLVYLRDVVQPLLGPLAKLGIVLVFTIFLLVEQTDVRHRLFRLAGLNRLNVMTQALDDATRSVSRYLVLQFLVNACFGVVCGIGLYLIGVPYAALWGAVAALLRIVPYVGSLAAGLFPLVLALAVFDQLMPPLLVFLLFAFLEVVTGNFLEPWLYGSHTGISSLALLVTTVFWATLWGPAGLILSTPLTVCVVVLGRHVPQLAFLHILLGDQPGLAPGANLYQRLLALDDQDARAVAEKYLKDNSLLQLYDRVLLPTLALAEQDRHKANLSPEREEFVFSSLRDMLVDFSERAETGERTEPARPGRILCFPAHDEADEIAAAMLAQLLDHAGYATMTFPLGSSPQSMLDLVEPDGNDVVCISALPPFVFSQARTMSRQIREKSPHTRILIGVWGFSNETERVLRRFEPTPPDKLVTSLADALEYLGAPKS